MIERPMHAFRQLAHVVRRNVGRHADGDTGRAVGQQVREARGQYGGFLRTAIVVGHEVDGVLVDVSHHFHRKRHHAALGVTHGCGRVVTGRAEVALPVDQRVSHRPWLGHAHQRIVDRGVAVWVVVAHHVGDGSGALGIAAIRTVAAVIHRVHDAAVHRLHAVAHIRKGSFDDDGDGIVEVRLTHLLLDVGVGHAIVVEDQLFVGLRADGLHRVFGTLVVLLRQVGAVAVFVCHLVVLWLNSVRPYVGRRFCRCHRVDRDHPQSAALTAPPRRRGLD